MTFSRERKRKWEIGNRKWAIDEVTGRSSQEWQLASLNYFLFPLFTRPKTLG